jgi:NAD(P)-dependent dehydrogenase (short-subunit alcohol dehydrogenase family)
MVMDLKLKGKVVLITGGATGIGKASALAFLKESCKVAICGRTQAKLDHTVQEFQEKGYEIVGGTADAGKAAAMNAFADLVVQKYGSIDVWINNAGIYPERKALLDTTEDEWDETFRINLKSVFIGTKIAATHMKKQGAGVILNASSFAAIIPTTGSSAYAATKSAIVSLTRTSAAELAPFNIRVVAYVPGMIRTAMSEPLIAAKPQFLTEQALGRLGEPEDIADTLVFLASDSAAYITGNSVEISGGRFCVQNPQYAW